MTAKEILYRKATEKKDGFLTGQVAWIVEAMEEYAAQQNEMPDPDDFDNDDVLTECIDEEPDYDHTEEELIEREGVNADNNRMIE